MTTDVIQAEIDAAWAAHEGDRDPGISDLEWQQHSIHGARTEFSAGPQAGKTVQQELQEAA